MNYEPINNLMAEQIRIVIVDDHNLIIEAWTALLSLEENIIVVGNASSAEEALQLCLECSPDVVLMDINLKESNGLDATEMICNRVAKVKVIGLSLHDDISIVKNLIKKGATGYLSKNSSKSELIEAINSVMSGVIYLGENIRNKLLLETLVPVNNETNTNKGLTIREIEVLVHISNGLTSKQIAENMFVSTRTIETHRYNILKKLKLQNAAQLSSWAREHGYF